MEFRALQNYDLFASRSATLIDRILLTLCCLTTRRIMLVWELVQDLTRALHGNLDTDHRISRLYSYRRRSSLDSIYTHQFVY